MDANRDAERGGAKPDALANAYATEEGNGTRRMYFLRPFTAATAENEESTQACPFAPKVSVMSLFLSLFLSVIFCLIMTFGSGCITQKDTRTTHLIQSANAISSLRTGTSLSRVQEILGDSGRFQFRFLDDRHEEVACFSVFLKSRFNKVLLHFRERRLVKVCEPPQWISEEIADEEGRKIRRFVIECPNRLAQRALAMPPLSPNEIQAIARRTHGARFVPPLMVGPVVTFAINPIGVLLEEKQSREEQKKAQIEWEAVQSEFSETFDPMLIEIGASKKRVASIFGCPLLCKPTEDGRVRCDYGFPVSSSPKIHVIFNHDAATEMYSGRFTFFYIDRADSLNEGPQCRLPSDSNIEEKVEEKAKKKGHH